MKAESPREGGAQATDQGQLPSYPRPLTPRDYMFVTWYLLDVWCHRDADCDCNACRRWAA